MREPPALSAPQRMVLKHLRDGPTWTRSLGLFKVAAEQLIAKGLVQRTRPKDGLARNMVALTPAGREALESMK